MLEIILEAVKRVGNLTDHQTMIVEMMKKNPKVSTKILSEHVNISKLKKLEITDRIGGTCGH